MIRYWMSLFLLFSLSTPVRAVDFGMKPAHFGSMMEFYYSRPQPEKLQPLLRTMVEKGLLDLPENRLMFAAFFGELMATQRLAPGKFLEIVKPLGKNARRLAAWALHFAGQDGASLLDAGDKILATQILATPPGLEAWPMSEPAAVFMFWAAFMASGERRWIEEIIKAALDSGNARQAAAASLYDFAPRHPIALDAVRERALKASGDSKRILDIILNHAEKKSD